MLVVIQDLVRQTSPGASYRLVLLHGWGADMEDLLPLGEELVNATNIPWELISLRAPHEHPTGQGRQWYGLFPPDWQAVPNAVASLKLRLLGLALNTEIPIEKTFLLGFSQGAAMAISAATELPLAGVVSCSGYPHPEWVPSTTMPPILLTHGLIDEVVPYEAAQELSKLLKAQSGDFVLNSFEGGHTIPLEIIPLISQQIASWLVKN